MKYLILYVAYFVETKNTLLSTVEVYLGIE